MKKWIYISLLIFCGQNLASQTNCDNIIDEAADLYNSGNYDECINFLENGLNTCSLSKSKKEKAYVLLINSNIEKDSLQGIDKNFRLLLKNSPTFKIKDYNGIDDFKKYFNNYYVYPKLAIGIRPHYSSSVIVPFKIYQAMPDIKNENQYITSSYSGTNLCIEYRVLEKFSFFADAGFFTLDYHRQLENNYWLLKSSEKLNFFQLDIGNKRFYRSQKKLNLYLMGGYSSLFLNKSELNLSKEITEVVDLYAGIDKLKDTYILDKFDSKKLRNKYVYSLFIGGGAIYRIGYIGIGLDYRTYFSLNTLNKKSARFNEPILVENYNYIDNDFRLFKTDFSIVFTYLFYQVKRKKIAQD